ncbi:hypothetical protein [Paraglaciecola sp. MB-3u-78]|uniref:dioxygenase family protein n=1 Tax=Paraglaciecola sp. MB-3u-78 TaxID=2058332 RepID=UPI000C32B9E9|nr:hypothetical protein [Paraglaciecola sp. MB-3u-78]PKG97986.1 hypothetical protein CXF95_16390 [Paraglaciecola sp. MB-3u-78]
MSSISITVSQDEPGIPLVEHGQIFKPNGREVANNTLVHLYHRDHAGFDFGLNDNESSTWRLQGWAKTDAQGKFEFHTIGLAPDHIARESDKHHLHISDRDLVVKSIKELLGIKN